MAARLKVTQIKSEIGGKPNQRETLRTLGLKRIGDIIVKDDSPSAVSYTHLTLPTTSRV